MPRLCTPEDVGTGRALSRVRRANYVNAATLMVDGGATVYMPSARRNGEDNATT